MPGERAVAAPIIIDRERALQVSHFEELFEAERLCYGRIPINAFRCGSMLLDLPGIVTLYFRQNGVEVWLHLPPSARKFV